MTGAVGITSCASLWLGFGMGESGCGDDDIPDLSTLIVAWLWSAFPTVEMTLCHGDFRTANAMFRMSEPRVRLVTIDYLANC